MRDERTRAKIKAAEGLPFPLVSERVHLYAEESEEVLLFADAIGVKAQKPKRDKPGGPRTGKKAKRHDFDLMVLQKADQARRSSASSSVIKSSGTIFWEAAGRLRAVYGT
jgi:hypothetical protein